MPWAVAGPESAMVISMKEHHMRRRLGYCRLDKDLPKETQYRVCLHFFAHPAASFTLIPKDLSKRETRTLHAAPAGGSDLRVQLVMSGGVYGRQ